MQQRARWSPIHVLLVVALVEMVVDRVVVPMTRPTKLPVPLWHQALDYLGLFTFFFTGALAAFLIGRACYEVIKARRSRRELVAHGWLALAALVAARPLILEASTTFGLVIELAFFGALMGMVISNFSPERDLGVQIGLPILVAPLLLHSAGILGGLFLWSADPFDGPVRAFRETGVTVVCVAALVTPYCFAPRPFARAVGRPIPLVIAMSVASLGAMLTRAAYPRIVKVAHAAVGIDLHVGKPDPQLALYLVAAATLTWTVISCALAESPSRRRIGLGIAFVALGGYAFEWPHHYLLPMLGAQLIFDGGRHVREQELIASPVDGEPPAVSDSAWQGYTALVAQGLRKLLAGVHSLTTRGEGGLVTSLIVGDAKGIPVRMRVERIEGSVTAIDIVLGTELDETRAATLVIQSIPAREFGVSPVGPPASPVIPASDDAFAAKFMARGSATAMRTLFDNPMRERTEALVEGWIAYWEGESVRFRVYPGRGAPVDHPIPLPDLAMGRVPPNADRLVAIVELLVDLAGRASLRASDPPSEPAELGA